jgi:hypothetical protein
MIYLIKNPLKKVFPCGMLFSYLADEASEKTEDFLDCFKVNIKGEKSQIYNIFPDRG